MAPAVLEMALFSLRPTLTRSASSESATSIVSGKTSTQTRYSDSFTPSTSAADSESVASAAAKQEITNDAGLDIVRKCEEEVEPISSSAERPRRLRNSGAIAHNVKVLDAEAVHTPGKFKAPNIPSRNILTRRRTIPGIVASLRTLGGSNEASNPVLNTTKTHTCNDMDAVDIPKPQKILSDRRTSVKSEVIHSPRKLKDNDKGEELSGRRATRSTGAPVENLTRNLSVLGKRGRNKFEASLVKAKRELKRLADTNEFAKIDTQTVIAEVWSKGKLVTGEEASPKRLKMERAAATVRFEECGVVEKLKPKRKGPKVWLNKGLYAGQEARNLDWFAAHTKEEKKRIANLTEFKLNGLLPLPMWHGQRLLHVGRNFKLPFDVCSPLPPGQPKPDEWRKVPKNRFVGDAAAAWKKSTVFDDFSSRCVCSSYNGCDESCQNRIMLYECDEGNCSAGKERCSNRAFAELRERRSKGGKYRIGVEVIKTEDRGYGVRSNRCFEAHQIIVEYTGEIITEEECDRRMNEDYKANECYYLMLFDQNMIIDATRGSIARFVNHSCEPNCRMVKWIVAGKPRMALFAGDRPIMSGDELTYDYNFDPFSAKNVQECRCGSENCRGILGPRPKDKPKGLTAFGETITNVVKARKRKLNEIIHGDVDTQKSAKKRKMVASTRMPRYKLKGGAKGLKKSHTAAAKLGARSGRLTKLDVLKNETAKSGLGKKCRSEHGEARSNMSFLPRNSRLKRVNDGAGKSRSKRNGKGRGDVEPELDFESGALQVNRSIRERKLSAKGWDFMTRKGIDQGGWKD